MVIIIKTITVQNIQELKNELCNREAEIELLRETFAEIGSELDLEKVFQIVAERARVLIQAETLLIPLLDENCETYTYRGGAGNNASEIVGESLPLDFGICGWVWRHKKPWWRGVLDELNVEERNMWEKEAGTVILMPLQGKRHFLGGIAGINKIGGGDFDKRDLTLMSLFSSIVSIAIENAMAVDKIEKGRRLTEDYQFQLERLNRQLTESSRELEYLSLYDNLTSLPNRSLFRDRLTQHISAAEQHGQTIGLLLIDLNDFKEINDTLGHDKGDSLLKMITQRFLEHINANETIARLGGDEFVLILPNYAQQQTLDRGHALLQLLEAPFKIDHTEIAVSASIGAAIYPLHGENIGTLLGRADQAMYMAKENKRGVSLYNPADDRSSLGQLTMTADLRKALEEQQFEIHYQPKLDIKTMQIDSVEALGRWSNPQRGRIPPNIFIHALEQAGMIDRYTYWLIETIQAQIALWHGKGFDLKVAINISTQTLVNPDFILYLEKNIKKQSVGNFILFEITENLFLSEYDRLADVLLRIRQLGIRLSIDDFGTGYSSLSRLKKLPVSELKIDQSFVRDMNTDADDEAIVRSTIDLAHNLGLTVVAEGIETEDVFNQLVALGCDIAQGYLIGKPMPVDLFDDYIQHQLYKKLANS